MEKETSLEETLSDIGSKLYTIRHTRKEKISAVAHDVGVSHAVLSRVENGRYKYLSITLLHKLAEHYKVPIVQLF